MQYTAQWGLDGTNTSLHAGYRERWNIRHVGFSWFRLLSLESFRSQPGNGHQQTFLCSGIVSIDYSYTALRDDSVFWAASVRCNPIPSFLPSFRPSVRPSVRSFVRSLVSVSLSPPASPVIQQLPVYLPHL